MRKVLVTGAGGFIGGHLVGHLVAEGYQVIAADKKPLEQWYQVFNRLNVQNYPFVDFSRLENCQQFTDGIDEVYNLAADMGGIGFIEGNKALCMLSVLINTHLLMASQKNKVKRYFYASSACVYAADKQTDPNNTGLKETDSYPAMPEDGYGWEKLFSERMCTHFAEDFGLECRIARLHNVYGPYGTYEGGREKAPAAIIRKVITAKLAGQKDIEIWGDGRQTRSFMYIRDCVEGIRRIMDSDVTIPLNLGSVERVTINQLVDYVSDIAGVTLSRKFDANAPKGVTGRNSDNTLIKKLIGWEPCYPLRVGLASTYNWVMGQMLSTKRDYGHE